LWNKSKKGFFRDTASKVMRKKGLDKPNLAIRELLRQHRRYSWQVAPQQSLLPLSPAA
jgi:hypothetical protein